MPQLAFDIGFCAGLHKLQPSVKKGVFEAWEKFQRLSLAELFKDPGLKLETLKGARDPHIRTIRIDLFTRGVVLAPDSGDTYVLLKAMPHDKAIAWALKQRSSINTVTRAVEIRDAATLDELTPAYERAAAAAEQRLFAKVSDKDLAALGIDADTLRQARSLTDKEQFAIFAPLFPQDQREVLEYLAEGFTVEEVWSDLVAHRASTTNEPLDLTDYETAIRHTRSRIALVTASAELQDILDKPFAAWRIFLHPSQHRVAYRPSYSGPAQVTGGPGTGKTVVALHRVKHLLAHLRDGDRILLTTYTNALVDALRSGLDTLVDDPRFRERVDIMTVDSFAARVLAGAPNVTACRPLGDGQEGEYWAAAVSAVGFPGTSQFLAQEYKHVILAQNLTNLHAYENASRRGRGSNLATSLKPVVWRAVEHFTAQLAEEKARTYLQTCSEAARLLADSDGPRYRHIVVDEAQDLHPAQWRLLRAAAPPRPDDLFIAGDPHQRIYDSKVSLKAIGIKVTGRSTKMRKNYRSTQEILSWSTALLIGRPIAELEDENRTETLLGYRSALHGAGPRLHAAVDEDGELEALVHQVRAWLGSGVLPEEIGVSTRFNKTCARAIKRLTEAGIPAARLRDGGVEGAGAVRVGTMHSFKGLEFRCVAVVGVHDGALPLPAAVTDAELDAVQHDADIMAERCLLFVACTRARDGLYVSWHGQPSRFLVEAGADCRGGRAH